MQTTDFLAAVLPPEGTNPFCVVELKIKTVQMPNGSTKEDLIPTDRAFVDTYEEIAAVANSYDGRRREAYFSLAAFASRDNRLATNAVLLKCLFADLDCGPAKPYGSAKEAVVALEEWCRTTGFPQPFLVSSGAGVHCYWPFSEPVSTSTWKPVADAFKRCCAAHGLKIDTSVSADAARVLRVPGTTNRKGGKERKVVVKVIGDPASPFERFRDLLSLWHEEPRAVQPAPFTGLDTLEGTAPAASRSTAARETQLGSESRNNFSKILNQGADGCLQIASYINNPTADGVEPLFRAVSSIAINCEEGERHVYALGRLHPYPDSRIAAKIQGLHGPHNCATFDAAFPGVCPSCKHFGKIGNPIMLGKELARQSDQHVTLAPAAAQPAPDGVAAQPAPAVFQFPEPPGDFLLNEKGIFSVVDDGEGRDRIKRIADTPLFASATYDRNNERFVQFIYVEHAVVKTAVLPMSVAVSKDDSIKAFAKLGVIVPTAAEPVFRGYLKATIAEAKRHPPKIMPTNLGWQPDNTFAFSNTVYSPSGTVEVPMFGFDNINDTIGIKGSLDGWRLVLASIMRMERWDLVAMMCIGFGAPLMRFTGLNGLTFHLCGNDSGRGKTQCQRLASSVWGNPDKFRVTPNTSAVAMINRLGMLGSLPLLVDEITHKGRAESEWFPEFLSQMSDGRGKDRMDSATNSERRNTTTWSTLALMTSNKGMIDYLTAERAHGSEGEIRRLIEIGFYQEFNMDPLTKSLLLDHLPENYGVAGDKFARWLVCNVDKAREVTKNTYTELFDMFGSTGDERFWIAGCACIVAGARLASSAYADVIDLNIGKIAAFLRGVVVSMRAATRSGKRTAEDILNAFTKRNYGKFVSVNGAVARIAGMEIAEVLDRRDLCGRVERGATRGYIDYFIEEVEIKAFCSSLSFGYTEFVNGLSRAKYTVRYVRKNLLAGTRGPNMVVRCIHVQQPEDEAESTISTLFQATKNDEAGGLSVH